MVHVTTLLLDSGSCETLTVRMLYKDWKYCMKHMFSHKQAILRDLLMYKVSELIASKMGTVFFPLEQSHHISKNKHFS